MCETKVCSACKIDKPFSDFAKGKRYRLGVQSYCKTCNVLHARKWSARNKDKRKSTQLKRKFGITLGDYNQMLESQGGVCATCNNECTSGNHLAVDHCHSTGKVRGLLCGSCNRALGLLKDDPKILSNLLDYLNKS